MSTGESGTDFVFLWKAQDFCSGGGPCLAMFLSPPFPLSVSDSQWGGSISSPCPWWLPWPTAGVRSEGLLCECTWASGGCFSNNTGHWMCVTIYSAWNSGNPTQWKPPEQRCVFGRHSVCTMCICSLSTLKTSRLCGRSQNQQETVAKCRHSRLQGALSQP